MADYFYAQIDANNVVIGVSHLAGEVTEPHMIALTSYDTTLLGQVHQADGTFAPPAVTLDGAKSAKITSLRASRDAAIYSTYTSSALGTAKTYSYDTVLYGKIKDEVTLLNLDSTIATVRWPTIEDGNFVDHTRAQFIQVVRDGSEHEKDQWSKYNTLVAQVNAATTVDAVNAVVWS